MGTEKICIRAVVVNIWIIFVWQIQCKITYLLQKSIKQTDSASKSNKRFESKILRVICLKFVAILFIFNSNTPPCFCLCLVRISF